MTMKALDPVSLEILWTRLVSLVDESAATLVRTSFSSIVRESNDYAVVLLDRNCQLLAQSSQSIPSFICTLPQTVRHFLDVFPREELRHGDIMITNDPWLGTGHLPDINVAMPIFQGEVLVGFAGTVAHAPDIGGRLRSPSTAELFEEGLRIPRSKLISNGEINQTLVHIIRDNVRVPDQVMGDIWAQVAANRMLGQRLLDTLAETKCDLQAVGSEMQARSERAMRSALQTLPDGSYEHEISVDGFLEPVTIRCRIDVQGDCIAVDFAGSSPQVPRAINVVPIYTFAYSAYTLKCVLAPNVPNNDGSFRPIQVSAPLGSILNPRFPAAVSARAMTGHLIPSAIMGALAQAIPDKVSAAPGSPLWCVHLAGADNGKRFASTFFLNGGQGATAQSDGLPTLSFPSNLSNTPIEVIETQAPVRVLQRALRRGTGGTGLHKGGDGQVFEILMIGAEPVTASFMADRLKTPAPGLLGGGAGAVGRVLLDGSPIDPREIITIQPGSRLSLETPGAGGFGTSQRGPSI
ncbi:hydantoinase B/oxoprolinase family protein [Terrihabitans sp. B22-R8]|uniref:hydantoinase B/oxoprolinase family protein n=1 Tax=Terrihabitans sp. B22-R8 TaxID=3425128 RepID=UPI00403C0403